jgi:nitrate/nitrite transport system permease protein
MAIIDDTAARLPVPPLKERIAPSLERIERTIGPLGLGWIVPLVRLVIGDRPAQQVKEIWHGLLVPLLAIAIFLWGWAVLAPRVVTS